MNEVWRNIKPSREASLTIEQPHPHTHTMATVNLVRVYNLAKRILYYASPQTANIFEPKLDRYHVSAKETEPETSTQ